MNPTNSAEKMLEFGRQMDLNQTGTAKSKFVFYFV